MALTAMVQQAAQGRIVRTSRESEQVVARISTRYFDELYVACAPDPAQRGSFEAQARSMYASLGRALTSQRAEGGVVLSERIFLAAIDGEFAELHEVRRKFYHDQGHDPRRVPATSYIQQPPCEPGQLCALQAHILVPRGMNRLDLLAVEAHDEYGSARILTTSEGRHVFIANIVPHDRPGPGPCVFADRAQHMFEEADAALNAVGFRWTDVMRTWFCLAEMDRDYGVFNQVRNAFYKQKGISRLPASTGISGAPFPSQRLCVMDLYAFQSADPFEAEPMHSEDMNEAPSYGAAFSRGLRLTTRENTTLFISGTASIDDTGQVVHVGDIERQVEKTCENIESLLAAQGATLDDVVSLISYLKSDASLPVFEKVLRRRSWPRDVPNTIVEAGVCRPDWLVEIEAIAVIRA